MCWRTGALLLVIFYRSVTMAQGYRIRKARQNGNELTVWVTTPLTKYVLVCKIKNDVSSGKPMQGSDSRNKSCGTPPSGLILLPAGTLVMFAGEEKGGKYAVKYVFTVK